MTRLHRHERCQILLRTQFDNEQACGRSATGLRNRALLTLLWRCGLRVGEALALVPSDLDPAAGTLRVPRGKTGHRTVGIDPEAIAVVEQWLVHRRAVLGLNGRRRVVCTLKGEPVLPSYARSLVKRPAAKAGIERRLHPHALRHAHAAELLREGVSVRHIQLQLGHASLTTTSAYLMAIQPAELVEVARSRPSWLRGTR